MKAHLLYLDRDVDFTVNPVRLGYQVGGPAIGEESEELIQDLELQAVLTAMAGGDGVLFDIAKRVMLAGLEEPEAIVYRQQILDDCIRHEPVVRRMLSIASSAVDQARKLPTWFIRRPEGLLRRSLEVLSLYVGLLRQLRAIADEHAGSFTSPGFSNLFATLQSELDDAYFQLVEDHLDTMRFSHGVPISAKFGPGLKPSQFVLRTTVDSKVPLKERLGFGPRTEYHWDLPPRDEAGSRALSELNDKAVAQIADAVGQSAEHITSFFVMLWIELGFYTACLNLIGTYRQLEQPLCFPTPTPVTPNRLHFEDLRDASLSLHRGERVVGNDADGDGKDLVLITGANSGGKSTFLRSVGLALVMMQAGMCVCASAFSASASSRIFTHFIREEDSTMTSGKLDEELARMSRVVDHLVPGSTVLFNESFAATNEREGSEIAGQIIDALRDSGVRVLFVTHQYTLADTLYRADSGHALFLRADRNPDGTRPFKLVSGEPLRTSYGGDLYRRIGGWGAPARPGGSRRRTPSPEHPARRRASQARR